MYFYCIFSNFYWIFFTKYVFIDVLKYVKTPQNLACPSA